MRLIDAIAYRRVLEEEKDYQLEHCKDSFKYQCGLEIAIADLGDMPTIDAVEVVRCKNCLYWQSGENECEKWEYCAFHNIGIGPHSFCSYGERKDGDGNG